MARLRLDSVNAMDPGAPDPIGTLKEIKKLKLPPLKYGTCSMPSATNRGCRHFDDPVHGPCPIRALLRERARPGPENVGFVRVKSPKVAKMDSTQCFAYMAFVAHDDPKNSLSHVLGLGGDFYIKRRTTQLKDKKDPRSGSRFELKRELVPKFPRPDVSMLEHSEVMGMAKEIIAAENRSALSSMLGGMSLEDDHEEREEVDVPDVDDDDLAALDDDDDSGDETEGDEETGVDGDGLGAAHGLSSDVDLEDEPVRRRGRKARKSDGD